MCCCHSSLSIEHSLPVTAAVTITRTADLTTGSSGWSSTTAACIPIPTTSSPRMRTFCFSAVSLTLPALWRASGRGTIAAERTARGCRGCKMPLKAAAQPAEDPTDYPYLDIPSSPSFGEGGCTFGAQFTVAIRQSHILSRLGCARCVFSSFFTL